MSNPLLLKFPQDKFGNLTRFKAEGLKAVERMYGNDEKLDTFIATVRTLVTHAKARHARQKAAREALHGVATEAEAIDPSELDAQEPEPEAPVKPEATPEPAPEPVPEPEQPAPEQA